MAQKISLVLREGRSEQGTERLFGAGIVQCKLHLAITNVSGWT